MLINITSQKRKMYSSIKSVQILIALLKKYKINDIVMAPGGSNIPLIHSIETDPDFNCYSVVDERSLVYFSIGIAQQKSVKVACICTSGTAVCNFLPGITEAFYQNVPIVAITADKDPYFQGQLQTQKINQHDIFGDKVKKMVELPIVNNEKDWWLCERLVNEALLEIDHHGLGPVHINIPIVGTTAIYDCDALPDVRRIERVEIVQTDLWNEYAKRLSSKKRIMVVIGQNIEFNDASVKIFDDFYRNYNCFFAVENLSNLESMGTINTYPLTEMLSTACGNSVFDKLAPDLIICCGNNLSAYDLKTRLRNRYKTSESWLINEAGNIRDEYKSLRVIFECKCTYFLERMNELAPIGCINTNNYYKEWLALTSQINIEPLEYSSLYIAKKLSEVIPEKSIIHTAILNSTRVMQFFKFNTHVKMFSNVGALGIDGCLSTFIGQAAATDNLAFLLIGDLSFFYDMNAIGIRGIKRNVRIIMLNNGGGEEFHFFMGKKNIPTINDYISVTHSKTAKGWVESLLFDYYPVYTKNDFDKVSLLLAQESEKPIFVEVFLNMETDAKYLRGKYDEINEKLLPQHILLAKKLASKLPEKQICQVRKVLKI